MDQSSHDLLNEKELWGEPIKPTRMIKRIVNLLIDTFFFYVLILTFAFVIAIIYPSLIDVMAQPHPVIDQLVGSLLFASYYLVFENWLGKSPGKIITKTKVVDKNGEKPVFKMIVWRSLSRMIPFDFITFVKQTPVGMHDRLSQTFVVDDRPRVSFDRLLADDEPMLNSTLPE